MQSTGMNFHDQSTPYPATHGMTSLSQVDTRDTEFVQMLTS